MRRIEMTRLSFRPTVFAFLLGIGLLGAWPTGLQALGMNGRGPESESRTLDLEQLKALQVSVNDPQGDSFLGTRPERLRLVDAFVADNSLVGPMLLYVAANTAMRLGRVEDAAFLFYAAQLRRNFDLKRYAIATQADGNNAATYLGYLNQSSGAVINPAIMQEPKRFSRVIARLETWELISSAQAYTPEFKEAKGFRVLAQDWPELARSIKAEFMQAFGKRYSQLLNRPDYFAAWKWVHEYQQGRKGQHNPQNQARLEQELTKMRDLEQRLFPARP